MIRSFLSIRHAHGDLCKQLGIDSSTDLWERSGSVVECLTRDRRVAGSSLTGVTAL